MPPRSKAGPTLDDRVRASSRMRRDDDKAALRDAIFRAAGELLLERGYEAFSLRQVAERVGYSATTIYRYFENKDDLVFGIVDEGFRIFGDRLRTAGGAGAGAPTARLRAVAEAYVRFGLEYPVYYRLMFLQRPDFLLTVPPGMQESRVATFRVLHQAAEDAITAGWARLPDAKLLSDVLWALVHGIVSLSVTVAEPAREERALATLEAGMAVVEAGLRG